MLSAIQYAHAWVVSHLRDERGQDLIEYALLGGLVAIALMAAALLLSPAITSMATGIGRCIDFTDVGSVCNPGP
ncbi:MAG TPA: Flp family type IVb pilin [Dehalococcoidia bacterium]|nr:Flp family type IVb pilin [Dehalococcoidia bacterium]